MYIIVCFFTSSSSFTVIVITVLVYLVLVLRYLVLVLTLVVLVLALVLGDMVLITSLAIVLLTFLSFLSRYRSHHYVFSRPVWPW